MADSPLKLLQDEFRRHVQTFYGGLQLAPPYESVEKAVRHLTAAVKALPEQEQQRLLTDSSLRWEQYRQAFAESGLSHKHRGIIGGLARRRHTLRLPPEYESWLDLYVREG
jgi:hypothetical protein